ncbi:MAG: NifU family protein [Elusimicrobia bacterium]|nr:NifU family protein [Candidatus Obscuribacterium magneticum]
MSTPPNDTPRIADIEATKKRVEAALDKVRPALQADGGGAEVVDLSPDGVLTLKLVGACGGCPMATMTLKNGIERIIQMDVPEVTAVEAIQAF